MRVIRLGTSLLVWAVGCNDHTEPECGDQGEAVGCVAGGEVGTGLGEVRGLACDETHDERGIVARGEAQRAYCFPDGLDAPGPPCMNWYDGFSRCFAEEYEVAHAAAWKAAGCDGIDASR